MAGGALTRDQFAAYAAKQIVTTEALLATHRPSSQMACSCGRPLPCPHAQSLAATRDHYRNQTEALERTQPLPAVVPPPRARPHPHRRTLIHRLWNRTTIPRLWKRNTRRDVC